MRLARFPDDVWEIVVPFLDLASLQSLLFSDPFFLHRDRLSTHFHATLTRQLTTLRDALEIRGQAETQTETQAETQTETQAETQAETLRNNKSVLLFLVGVYLYHPHIVRKLTVEPYLDRFVRFFRDVPFLLEVEKKDEERPSRLLQHLLREYKLGIMT
jgi:hypothetical protein